VECIRGKGYRTLSQIAGTGVTLMVWIVVIVSMVLIYCMVPGTEKQLRRYGHGTDRNLQLSHLQVGIQANLYIAAFMMSYMFLVLVQLVEAEETRENRMIYFGLACLAKFL
jgi:heme/copper-type cytochrome/quinol oxidase subunit 2